MGHKVELYLAILLLIITINAASASEASNEPKIVDQVEKLNHQEGTNATFTCSIGSGDLSSLTFDWFKDDVKLFQSKMNTSKVRLMTQPDNFQSLLRVFDLKLEDSGVYSCVARNKFGQDKISTKLTVKVQLKWLAKPEEVIDVRASQFLEVTCSATGLPNPKIEWYKVDEDGTVRLLGQGLRFESIKQGDAGTYQCRASNSVEKDLISKTSINILGK